jgi:pimeloyl-ACP methyl ester carboxylesterase
VDRDHRPASTIAASRADYRGTALPAGHFPPEEAPDLVLKALAGFLGES